MKTRRPILNVLCGVLLIVGTLAWTGCGPVEQCLNDADCNAGSHHCEGGLCRPLTHGASCKYGGKFYKAGDSFPSTDGCNTCSCSKDGRVACTLRACAPDTCKYNGKTYKVGESFPSTDGCNTCSCSKGGAVACTEKACPPPTTCDPNKACAKGYACIYTDGHCNPVSGDHSVGKCMKTQQACDLVHDPVCGCDGKTYSNACHAHSAGVTVNTKGACGGTCSYNGKTYKVGDTYPSTDGCNTCSCQSDGKSFCTKRGCATPCGGIAGLKCPNKDQYCEYSLNDKCGIADATGICKNKPQACDDGIDWVCGCDGKSYSNPCEAHAVGVSVAAKGKCATGKKDCGTYKHGETWSDGCNSCVCNDGQTSCTGRVCDTCGGVGGLKCKSGHYCQYKEGTCGKATPDQSGFCQAIPQGCTKHYEPVCGCDGKTYGNPCMAASAGVSIQARGECKSTATCTYNGKTYKAGDTFPSTDGCNNCSCGKDGSIACTQKACAKQCGGIAGLQCKGADEYCSYPGGTCKVADRMGTCAKKPQACTEQYDPVCGCDGKTYGNACSAASAGMSVDYKGKCKP